jgi:hypothetical protein
MLLPRLEAIRFLSFRFRILFEDVLQLILVDLLDSLHLLYLGLLFKNHLRSFESQLDLLPDCRAQANVAVHRGAVRFEIL